MSSEGREGIAATIAIVGGGIVGLSAAWRLAQQGWRVTVFDQGSVGKQASWAGAGMLAPGGEVDEDSPTSTILFQARALYPAFVSELAQEAGMEIELQQNGALELAYSDIEWSKLRARAARQQAIGITSKPVTVERVRAFWPRVQTEGLAGAQFYPGDAVVNTREVVAGLRLACLGRGVELLEHAGVGSIAVEQDRLTLCSPAHGTEQFSHTIIAAGAWSSSIRLMGLPPLPRSEPVKGHLLGYQQPLATCATILRHGHTYLLQRASGLLIAGASVERVGFDSQIDGAVVDGLVNDAGKVLPHLLETSPNEVWTGLRPGADQLQVGRWHSDKLLLAYGHYRNGILLAPWTAQRLTELLGHPE